MKEKNNTNLAGRKLQHEEPQDDNEDHELKIKEMFEKFTSNKQSSVKQEDK